MIEFIAFLGHYASALVGDWFARIGGLLGLVGTVEWISGKTLLQKVPPRWKAYVVLTFFFIAQISVYRTLHSRLGVNQVLIDAISAQIAAANRLKGEYRAQSPNDFDYADPKRAVEWEGAVCEMLSKARDRSLCIRFKNRLAPLDNPANQRRDALDSGIDARMERLEQLQMDLAKPQ